MLWELITREVPYDGLDPQDIRESVEKGEPLRTPYGVDAKLSQLINECRATQSASRPSFNRIVQVLAEYNK